MQRFVDQTSLFMTLVGLTALLVGGIGVATGVRGWLEARARSIATLRCLGASGNLVLAVYLIQVMALSAVGVMVGLVVGAALPGLAVRLLGDLLPVPADARALSAAAAGGGGVRAVDGGLFRALAARSRGADSRRGAVPRRGAARSGAPRRGVCSR